MTAQRINAGLFTSATNEWATPPALFDAYAAEFGGFTLDPAATPDNAKCPRFYTAEEDGLAQPWAPERVWLNPPYGRAIGAWVRKAYYEAQAGALVVCLLPARTDTAWWHDWVKDVAEVRFLRGRVKFGDGRSPAPFPSVIAVYRQRVARFVPRRRWRGVYLEPELR